MNFTSIGMEVLVFAVKKITNFTATINIITLPICPLWNGSTVNQPDNSD
jgi:hypothetical protein